MKVEFKSGLYRESEDASRKPRPAINAERLVAEAKAGREAARQRRRYQRTPQQVADAKRVSNRIMGERGDE